MCGATPFQLADLYELREITAVAVAPDGRRAAFVVRSYRRQADKPCHSLWVVETDGRTPPHRLTRGCSDDVVPAFSPDGRCLAFLSTRPHEPEVADRLAATRPGQSGAQPGAGGADATPAAAGADATPDAGGADATPAAAGGKTPEPKPQIWALDLARGGEPRQITWLVEGVVRFDWAPDSGRLVFAARTPTAAQQRYLEAVRGEQAGPLVIRRAQFKQDGAGYLDDVQTHLYVVDLATREPRQITHGACSEKEPRWSPDGQWIAFVSNRTGDPDNNRRHDLWLVSPDGAAARRLTFGDVGTMMSDALQPRWSPDSRHVAFLSLLEPENTYRLQHLCCVAVADAEPVPDLAACVGEGFAGTGGVVPDEVAGDPVQHARVYPQPLRRTRIQVLTAGPDRPAEAGGVWLDSRSLLVLMADRGQVRVARCALDGGPELLFPGPGERMSTVTLLAAAAGTAVVGIDRPEAGPDLFALPAAALGNPPADPVRLTALNAGLFACRTPAPYQRVEFPNSDGQAIEALVALPPGFDPARGPAPLLASIHGGPMWYHSPAFEFERQFWAGQGYVVLMVNYRGSTSYGEDFCQAIRGGWGPREHDDLMCGVDHLIRLGWANPGRLFCTGFSYGGIMTNWAVGHTDRFRAAASEHSVWDYVSAYGTDDCTLWWQDDLGVPWQTPELYRRTSPMSAVSRIRTPLLIMAGKDDWRCALNQSEQLYTALKKRGVPTELVIYQGEHHAVTRPRRAIDRLRRICRWFERYGGPPLQDDSAAGHPDPQSP